MTRELVQNIGLAFLAGFITSLGIVVERTGDVPPTKTFIISAVGAAIYAGVRGAIGYVKLHYGKPMEVDE
jgi:hypothetical protein